MLWRNRTNWLTFLVTECVMLKYLIANGPSYLRFFYLKHSVCTIFRRLFEINFRAWKLLNLFRRSKLTKSDHWSNEWLLSHCRDVMMSTMTSQIIITSIVYSTVCSGAYHRTYQSSAELAFVRGIQWSSVNFQHKGSITRVMFPFDDIIIRTGGRPLSEPPRGLCTDTFVQYSASSSLRPSDA